MSNGQTAVDQNTIRRRGVGVSALDRERAYPGYTLFALLTANGKVYLIDLDGVVVHECIRPNGDRNGETLAQLLRARPA